MDIKPEWVIAFGFVSSLVAGRFIIAWLTRQKIGQHIRAEGPKSHQVKAGTPSMGGIIFIAGASVSTIVWHLLTKTLLTHETLALLLFPALYAVVGGIDDYRKVKAGKSLGLRAREKMTLQILFAALFMFAVSEMGRGTSIIVPFTGAELDLGPFYGLFGVLVIVSAGNAVNLTDGLDGLATGTTLVSLLAYLYIAIAYASYTGAEPLSAPIMAWIGALLGFLVYNKHPAKVFMGDTGSNALGALLAAIAIFTRTELVLILIAGVPVIEALSDILQVISFQGFGKRIFKMAPLHHHFELSGVGETTIVWAFCAAQAAFALLGIWSMASVR